MITATVNVDPPFEVVTLTLESGERFLAIRCDGGLASIILPGLDAEAVTQAQSLATALESAAAALAETLPTAEALS